jgi:hypothetical protein
MKTESIHDNTLVSYLVNEKNKEIKKFEEGQKFLRLFKRQHAPDETNTATFMETKKASEQKLTPEQYKILEKLSHTSSAEQDKEKASGK